MANAKKRHKPIPAPQDLVGLKVVSTSGMPGSIIRAGNDWVDIFYKGYGTETLHDEKNLGEILVPPHALTGMGPASFRFKNPNPKHSQDFQLASEKELADAFVRWGRDRNIGLPPRFLPDFARHQLSIQVRSAVLAGD